MSTRGSHPLLVATPLPVVPVQAADPPPVGDERVKELRTLHWGMFVCWSFSSFSGREWTPGVTIASGTTLGSEQRISFAAVTAQGFRLSIPKADEVPTICELELYDTPAAK